MILANFSKLFEEKKIKRVRTIVNWYKKEKEMTYRVVSSNSKNSSESYCAVQYASYKPHIALKCLNN